jgi:phage head maturation protease
MATRPKAGSVETRHTEIATNGRKIHGIVPYGTESRDLGGWKEVISPGALDRANLDDLVATVDHSGVPLGRYPTTLSLEDRSDGLHWAVDPPASREDVREAVERGDLRAGSWRMVVGKERWDGDTRHVQPDLRASGCLDRERSRLPVGAGRVPRRTPRHHQSNRR